MSHDSHAPPQPDDPFAPPPDDHNPAIKDAKTILLIVVVSIALFAGVVYFFVL